MACKVYKAFVIFYLLGTLSACSINSNQPAPAAFSSPEAALSRLEQVVASKNIEDARELFGSDGDYLIHRGDPVADQERGRMFAELFNQYHSLNKNEDNSYTVLIGPKMWPFPVPLQKNRRGWYFNSEIGREEILTRTIGANELRALEVVHDIYHAQRNYAAKDWDEDGIKVYAPRLISSTGMKDGLYWPVEQSELPSPLNATVSKAIAEDYHSGSSKEPRPYRGYFFKLYTSPPVPDSVKDTYSKPGKYWLIATPAKWGLSGIMTFALNERGWIYEKDFGHDLKLETEFNGIDQSWARIE